MSTVLSARKIWDIDRTDPGKGVKLGGEVHPDLIRFKDHWYCSFKESGRSRLIRSVDGEAWQTVKVFDWDGVRMGRPYLSITAEGQLMVNSWMNPLGPSGGKRKNDGTTRFRRQFSVTWLTEDGEHWSGAHAASLPLYFSTTWFDGVGYNFGTNGTLYYTLDGRKWDALAADQYPTGEVTASFDRHDLGNTPGQLQPSCSEAGIAFDPSDGRGYALLRTNPICAMLGVAHTPHYNDWSWKSMQVDWEGDGNLVPADQVMGVQLGGPRLQYLSDGRLIGSGRADNSTEQITRARVILFFVDPPRGVITPFAKLDGYGHYHGVVEHDGDLWVACGNESQQDAFEVFLLRVSLP